LADICFFAAVAFFLSGFRSWAVWLDDWSLWGRARSSRGFFFSGALLSLVEGLQTADCSVLVACTSGFAGLAVLIL
jgi:hypothetical protein